MKTKALISCVVTAQPLISCMVTAQLMADLCLFSHMQKGFLITQLICNEIESILGVQWRKENPNYGPQFQWEIEALPYWDST